MSLRLTRTLLIAGAIPFAAAPLGAQSSAARSDFPPLVGAVPRGVARVLVIDSAAAPGGAPGVGADAGDHATDCASRLRDPRSGATYQLTESKRVGTTSGVKRGESIVTTRTQGNYGLVAPGRRSAPPRIPPDRFLRVACGSNEVLGIGRTFSADK